MALPLLLEGVTLGQRHHHYNNIVKEARDSKVSLDDLKSKAAASDLDEMFKIDMASHYRDVDYIFQAFKSEDLLQVSRAIKKSTWLITDHKYKQLININYLNEQLFPQMTSKAICKLLLAIRIHLRDEERVDEFYKYYEKENVPTALRWLPYCSIKVMEEAVTKYHAEISPHLFKRLCEKTISVLDLYVKDPISYQTKDYIKVAMFLINTHPEKFLNIAERVPKYRAPNYNAKHTELLMKHCKNRILEKFDYYAKLIHLPTFGICLGRDQIKDFLIQKASLESSLEWFNHIHLKPLLDIMPNEGKFDFIKSVFIDSDKHRHNVPPVEPRSMMLCMSSSFGNAIKKRKYFQPSASHKGVYELYKHATFQVAFPELKKLIHIESSADERSAMLSILVGCVRHAAHATTLLQYYHDHHINEPFKNKVQFVNSMITKTKVHKYDEHQWKLLQILFRSMDVYVDSEANVQKCLEADIIYKIIRSEPVSEIVLKKFNWNTMKHFYKQLSHEEREIAFKFLYDLKAEKISSPGIDEDEALNIVDDILSLLIDWDKDIVDYPLVINKLKEILQLKREPCWGYRLSDIFNNKRKTWRRHLFEESLIVNPSEAAVINALKHDPELLSRYQDKVDSIRSNDHIFPKRLLRQLRIYWPTLAIEWTAAYRQQLGKPGGHKAAVSALCTLLAPTEFIPFVETYAPENSKINWQDTESSHINKQKLIAKSLHLARPQPSPDIVWLFLKGDYVQFALFSLSAIFYNLSYMRARENIGKLLDAPVSIQKHGLRFAAVIMNLHELEEALEKIWSNTKNSSIRAVIFQIFYKQLCKQKNSDKVLQVWELLSKFIDSLSEKDNKIIFTLLSEVRDVPKEVQGKFCEKSYKFLKTLPVKAGMKGAVRMLAGHVANVMDSVDPQFVHELLLEHIILCSQRDKQLINDQSYMIDVVVAYLLCADSEQVQMYRYEEIVVPIMKLIFEHWDFKQEGNSPYREYFETFLFCLRNSLKNYTIKPNNVVPTKMFSAIHQALQLQPDRIRYVTLECWALSAKFVECAAKIKPTLKNMQPEDENLVKDTQNKEWLLLCYKIVPQFNAICINRIREVVTRFPSISAIYSKILRTLLSEITTMDVKFLLHFYKSLLMKSDHVPVYVVVLMLLPKNCEDAEEKLILEELKRMIYNHKSDEVKMHYFSKFADEPKVFNK